MIIIRLYYLLLISGSNSAQIYLTLNDSLIRLETMFSKTSYLFYFVMLYPKDQLKDSHKDMKIIFRNDNIFSFTFNQD